MLQTALAFTGSHADMTPRFPLVPHTCGRSFRHTAYPRCNWPEHPAFVAQIVVRQINESGPWRKRRRLPILSSRRRRTRIPNRVVTSRLCRVQLQFSGFEIHTRTGVHVDERFRGQDLSCRPIHHIHASVSIRVREHFSRLPVDIQVEKNLFVHAVVIMQIVRVQLIGPDRLSRFGAACDQRRPPFVIAWPLLRIPGPGLEVP